MYLSSAFNKNVFSGETCNLNIATQWWAMHTCLAVNSTCKLFKCSLSVNVKACCIVVRMSNLTKKTARRGVKKQLLSPKHCSAKFFADVKVGRLINYYIVSSVWSDVTLLLNLAQYTVSQKNKQNYFCYNYAKLPPNLTIFGIKTAESKIICGALIFHLT